MLASLLAAWALQPDIDWVALAPEIIVTVGAALIIIFDSILLERARPYVSMLGGATMLGAMIPIIFLAHDGADRVLFGGSYVVDNFALLMKAIFLLSGYVVILMSTNYIAEGDYWENEYYTLLVASLLGMVVMSSARDLVTIFLALELLSMPAYLLATWRKRDLKSNEAGLKYFLMGVFATAVMLYGMSLLFGVANSTKLADIATAIGSSDTPDAIVVLGVVFIIAGFAFKVSAFPFHAWAPDVYEGAPTPVTAFLAVASKAAGFVALLQLVFVAFSGRSDIYQPLMWVLAAASMTFGNMVALRQRNIVRLMAYSGIAQAGYMLAPLVVSGYSEQSSDRALEAILSYLVVYAAMNLGVFAVIIAVARKTRSADLDSYNGLFGYAPGLAVTMTIFLMSLAGIPPLGGWFAKLQIFRALLSAESFSGVAMGVLVGVNSVIALYYYAQITRRMWADEVTDGDTTPIRIPPSLVSAVAITVGLTLLFGVLPQVVGHFTEVSRLVALGG